jgi:hypothetical protein
MADLRSALEEAMAQAEAGELEAPVEKEIEVEEQDSIASEAQQDEKPRDEKGRFKSESEDEVEPSSQDVQAEEQVEQIEEPVEEKPTLVRPTTWKKEYLPLWDKMERGEALSKDEAKKMLEYANQRESEYKKGVSAYKAEADAAKTLREAIEPFVPELQKNGIHPAAWINNLGRAHMILTNAPMQQKVEMFNRLAQDYGIDLNLYQNSGENTTQLYNDPQTVALQQQIQMLNSQVQQVTGWRQQEENNRLQAEISRFSADVEKHPHFEAVREQMAQLLENGLAPDLETAYAKAVRLNDQVWQAEQDRLLEQTKKEALKSQQVAKAKSVAVSPKSVTPSGKVLAVEKKDRRSLLEEQLGSSMSNRV